MKYTKEKVSSLEGATEVRISIDDSTFRIIASPKGLCFCGESPLIYSREDLDGFAKLVAMGYEEFRKLKPHIEIIRDFDGGNLKH